MKRILILAILAAAQTMAAAHEEDGVTIKGSPQALAEYWRALGNSASAGNAETQPGPSQASGLVPPQQSPRVYPIAPLGAIPTVGAEQVAAVKGEPATALLGLRIIPRAYRAQDIIRQRIYFGQDTDRLEADAKGDIAAAFQLAEREGRKVVSVFIEGHTIPAALGWKTARYYSNNQGLSEARAKMVALHIAKHHGIPKKNIHPQGAAGKKPLTKNEAPKQQALNRRAELILVLE